MTELETLLNKEIDSIKAIEGCRTVICRHLVKQFFKDYKSAKPRYSMTIELYGLLNELELTLEKNQFVERLKVYLNDINLIKLRIGNMASMDDKYMYKTKTILKNIDIYQSKNAVNYRVKNPREVGQLDGCHSTYEWFYTLKDAINYRDKIIDVMYQSGIIEALYVNIPLGVSNLKERRSRYGDDIKYVVYHDKRLLRFFNGKKEMIFDNIMDAIQYRLELDKKLLEFRIRLEY